MTHASARFAEGHGRAIQPSSGEIDSRLLRSEQVRVIGQQIAIVPFVVFIALLGVLAVGAISTLKLSASNQPTTSPVEYLLYACLGGAFLSLPVALLGAIVWAIGEARVRWRERRLAPEFEHESAPVLADGERMGWWLVKEASLDRVVLVRQPASILVWGPLRWFLRLVFTTFFVSSIISGFQGGAASHGFIGATVCVMLGVAATKFVAGREIEVGMGADGRATLESRLWIDRLFRPVRRSLVPSSLVVAQTRNGVCMIFSNEVSRPIVLDRLPPPSSGCATRSVSSQRSRALASRPSSCRRTYERGGSELA